MESFPKVNSQQRPQTLKLWQCNGGCRLHCNTVQLMMLQCLLDPVSCDNMYFPSFLKASLSYWSRTEMSRSLCSTSTVWRRWPKHSLRECMSWRKSLSMLRYIWCVKVFHYDGFWSLLYYFTLLYILTIDYLNSQLWHQGYSINKKCIKMYFSHPFFVGISF